jgi:APA family basic amino acid/polyamine antiporter
MAVIYNPTLTSVLAWVSARFTCVLLGWDITGGACMTIAGFYLVAVYAMNALSPVIAGRFQVTNDGNKAHSAASDGLRRQQSRGYSAA